MKHIVESKHDGCTEQGIDHAYDQETVQRRITEES